MEIRETRNGRGVIATKNYRVGELIEESHVIVLNKSDTKKIDDTVLYDYYYSWGEKGDLAAIALGNGSLYNHSYKPNAKYVKRLDAKRINFIAIKPIQKGDEFLVNYNGDPYSKVPLWFNTATEE